MFAGPERPFDQSIDAAAWHACCLQFGTILGGTSGASPTKVAFWKKTAMSNIVRDSEVCELTAPPVFSYGEKVKAKRTIRNDGTYAGKEIGEILAKKGEEGYVVSIGTFLQQFYIYGVEFIDSGNRVGMKRKELDPAHPREDVDLPLP
jgi:nitrogen fixation protein NifZ